MSEKDIIVNFNHKKSNIMKTFKHKHGHIAEVHGGIASACGFEFPAWMVENDAWQEVTKDYKILRVFKRCGDIHSVKRLSDEKVFSVDEVYDSRKIKSFMEVDNTVSVHYDDGTWHYLRSVQPEKDYEILEVSYRDSMMCLANRIIHSVKRSDGEVFSVRDGVEEKDCPEAKGKIQEFKETDEGLLIIYEENMGSNYLQYIQKSRQPILTSENGVELFEGDKCAFITRDDPEYTIGKGVINKDDPSRLKYILIFSTHEAAEEYRLKNARMLSLNDVLDNFNTMIERERLLYMNTTMITDLEKLIKSRLLIS